MKQENLLHGHAHIIDNLRRLPRKMLNLHGLDNVTEFVLHELSSKSCFNLKKAAYFIDNPDFNCLKGVVGVSNVELHDIEDVWKHPELFTQYMAESSFNKNVRSLMAHSHKKNDMDHKDAAKIIADQLGLNDYSYYSWDMKHNNHGFLVCEKDEGLDAALPHDDIIIDGLSLLGFCPVH